MTTDPVSGVRAELMAAMAILDPQIDGLGDLVRASISQDAKEIVVSGLTDRTRRRDLILALLSALGEVSDLWAKLKADGYPGISNIVASVAVFDELKKESEAIATAIKIFGAPSALKMELTLGGITKKET